MEIYKKLIDDRLKTDCCGGYKSCKDRRYDKTADDCKDCVEDSIQAIEDTLARIGKRI